MIRVFKSGEVARADILYRGESGSTQAVEDAVADILADVKKNGDAAVLRYCEKFDGVKLAGLRVAQADIGRGLRSGGPGIHPDADDGRWQRSRPSTNGRSAGILSSTTRPAWCWARR